MSSRRQFSSCGPCRKSRLGCDAITKRGGRCSNCIRRKKSCTSDWVAQCRSEPNYINSPLQRLADVAISDIAAAPTGHDVGVQPHSGASPSSFGWEFTASRRQNALALHYILWDIFRDIFEPQLGIWIGNDCNPFKRVVTAPKTLISRLMVTLDNHQSTSPSSNVIRNLGLPTISPDSGVEREESTITDQALMSAVHAFAARWLPLEHFRNSNCATLEEQQEAKAAFLESIWKRAQGDVSRVMTTPSYRSILALYLFGITPISLKNKERRFSDLCLEIHLRHYIKLRSMSRIRHQSNMRHLGNDHSLHSRDTLHRDALEYTHLEDTAFWFGVVCDTSRCLIKCQSAILLPALTGDAKVWNLVRKQVKGFDITYRPMQTSRNILSDDDVLTIIQYGSSCKTLCWAAISHVQDSIIHQMTGLSAEAAVDKAVMELNRFEDVFGSLLDHIARDYLLLGEKSRVSYFLLTLHYHMGVLILVDTLDTMHDVSTNFGSRFNSVDYRLTSTRAIVNLMNLSQQTDAYSSDSTSSLLLRDPYPEHVSNCLSRAAYSIISLSESRLLNAQAADIMASTVFSGLEILSQVSYTATETLATLKGLFSESGLNIRSSRITPLSGLVSNTAALSNSPVTSELFDDVVVQELGQQAIADPSLVNRTIERHEADDIPAHFVLDDLQWIDFNAVRQDWAFEDCFSSQ